MPVKKLKAKKRGYSEKPTDVTTLSRGFGFPRRLLVKLRYRDQVLFTGTGTTTNRQYRINSLFDPNFSLGGHQPYYFDELKAVYSEYCVVRCKYTVKFVNANSTVAAVNVATSELDMSSIPGSVAAEYPRAYDEWIPSSGASPPKPAKGNIDLATFLGTEFLEGDPKNFAAIGADPNETAYMCIFVNGPAGSESLAVWAKVTLDMYVVFRNIIPPGQSLTPPSTQSGKLLPTSVPPYNPELAKKARIELLEKELAMLRV
jgi:hypothetical protein